MKNCTPFLDEHCDALSPFIIYEDNQSCIKALHNERITFNLRHIRMRYYWIKQHIRDGTIKVLYVRTDDQLADGFTKALDCPKFTTNVNKFTKDSSEFWGVL